MATISKSAIQWMQDQHETLSAQIDELEEELEIALDENRALRLENARLMMDRSTV